MNRIIVTGASGHIGFHVSKKLLAKNYTVVLLTRSINQNIRYLQNNGAEVHECDLSEPETYEDIFQIGGVLFHIASLNTINTRNRDEIINGTFNLSKIVIDIALQKGIKSIIYTSSVVVLGRSNSKKNLVDLSCRIKYPESPYVEGKLLVERYCDGLIEKGYDIRRLYPSWVLGDNDTHGTPPHLFLKNVLLKGAFLYFKGGVSLSDVTQVAEAHVAAFEIGKVSGRYLLGGSNITFFDLYQKMTFLSGKTSPKVLVPKLIIFTAAIILKFLTRLLKKDTLIDPDYVRAVIGKYSWYDSTSSVNELGYKIPDIDELLEKVIIQQKRKLLGIDQFYYFKKRENHPGGQSILITGFPGWLGNRLVDTILKDSESGGGVNNYKLLVHPMHKSTIGDQFPIEIVEGDITDKSSLTGKIQGTDTIIHIAGVIYPKKIKTLYQVNSIGTKNLVDECVTNGVERFIFIGTDSICGRGTKLKRIFDGKTANNPYRNYGKSKSIAEDYVLENSKKGLIKGTSLRAFWFFGPFAPDRQLDFLKMFNWPRQIVFGDGNNYRSITHVDNLIHAIFLVLNNVKTHGKWYWITDDDPGHTVNDIYRKIAEIRRVTYKPLYIPIWVCKIINIADLILSKIGILHPTIHAAGKFYFDIAGRIDEAKHDFNYHPIVSFEEAIEELKSSNIK